MILICVVTGDPCEGWRCARDGCERLAHPRGHWLPLCPCEVCGEPCAGSIEPAICSSCAADAAPNEGV